ncbi:16S rRNA (guanine(966)-N(2))-methyltransferase RsmD [Paraferrimonas haliotis]|uniref:Ribosomal RNA small subunit methyltransferase D n=1 Tax=Paraferrimonas haliotis TaxID=2013866 RepID=A0AA37TM97_9GAMM|nr:16S rRNA (guanine(966)-N(2))-methyltransferase RsmD [Paraferrimonas haliotis]GLS82080.1 ribosomal RNA small subunit methyltransferase D [Paraferrimonas haliotis]
MVKRTQTKSQGKSGQVRIISGQWRGRRLPVANVEGLRPTTDRVRETLFNWLMADVHSAHVLDLFSGSGALAMESLSRYAASALLFEQDAQVVKTLKANLASLKCDHAKVYHGNTLQLLRQPPARPFDVIFIDPPFRKGLLQPCIELLQQQPWLADNALIYIECESELTPNFPDDWQPLKQKTAGQVTYYLVQKHS